MLLVGGGYDGGGFKDMWVLDVDRGVWSEVSELISLVYDELYQEYMLCVYVLLLTYMWLCALNLLYSQLQ